MADWNKPVVGDPYATILSSYLVDRDTDAATMAESPTNPPTNYKRWNTSLSKLQNWNSASWDDLVLSIAGGGTGGATAAAARSNLGLGSMAVQNANAVAITGGSISGITVDASAITTGTLALLRGGTGASLSLGANGTVLMSNGSAVVFASGANIANLNASNLSSGTVPDARFPATLPALNGSALTNLNASNLATGTIPNGRFPAVLPAADGSALTNLTLPSPVKFHDDSDVVPDGTVYDSGTGGGIVMASAYVSGDGSGLELRADGFNPPVTTRAFATQKDGEACSITVGIPGGWFFKVNPIGSLSSSYCKFFSLS